MNNNLENRQIRIFISSTFLDMEEERKHLMEDIFPLLHDKAMQRDVSLTALDLRWGIPQKEVKKGRTIEICMNEIDNSRPFFIGLIGARYGWCPSINEYYNNNNLKERFPLLEGFFKERLSVTDMEMRYAVLNRDICDMDLDAFFFLKKTPPLKTDKEEYLKLEQLKKDIQEKKNLFPVYEYASVKEIGEHVLNEFEHVLDRYFPVDETNISSLQRERNRQKAYRNHLCRNYIGYSAYIDKLDSFLNSEDKKIEVLVGESGMGKSALLAKWLQEHDKDKFNNIIYHFVGNGESECNHLQIVSRIIDEIRDIYNIQIGENEERQESYMDADVRIERMFRRIPEDKHMVIVIDGLNQITDVQDSKLLRWLPEPPENVKYIFSTLENDKTYIALQQKDLDILRLEALKLEQRKELIVRYLKSFCKKLDSEEQIQTIASDPQNANTLVLRTLLDELITVGQYDKMDDIISYYLHADSIDDFFQRVIERITTDNQKGWIKDVLSLIAVSKRGLSEKDILSITNTYQFYWSSFYCAFKNHFIVRNGLITFAHQYIRQAVEKKQFGTPSDILRNRGILINYFKEKESNQAYEELAYQYYKCEKYDELYDILIKQEIFTYLYDNDEFFLVQCWATLDQKDRTKYEIRKLFTSKPKENIDNAEWIWIQYRFKVKDIVVLVGREDLLLASLKGLEDVGLTRPQFVNIYISKADYFSNIGKKNEALKYYQYAYSYNDNYEQRAYILNGMGRVYLSDNNPQKAINILEFASSIAIEYNNYSELLQAYTGLAEAYSELGDYENYEKYYQQSAQYIDAPEGTTTIDGAFSLRSIAKSEFHTGRYEQAHHHLHQALRIFKKAYNNKGAQVAEVYHLIGSCYYCRKQYKTAILCKQKALGLLLEVDKDHLRIPHVMKDIALNYQELGDLNNSILYYFRALRRCHKIGYYEEMANIYQRLAMNYRLHNCYPKAFRAITKGVEYAHKCSFPTELLIGLNYGYAICYYESNDLKKAYSSLCETIEFLSRKENFDDEIINSVSNLIGACYEEDSSLKTVQLPSVLPESLSIRQKLTLIQNEELSLTEKIHMVLLPMDDFYQSLIRQWGRKIGKDNLSQILTSIAYSYDGLTGKQIMDICKLDYDQCGSYISTCYAAVKFENGKYSLMNHAWKDAIIYEFFNGNIINLGRFMVTIENLCNRRKLMWGQERVYYKDLKKDIEKLDKLDKSFLSLLGNRNQNLKELEQLCIEDYGIMEKYFPSKHDFMCQLSAYMAIIQFAKKDGEKALDYAEAAFLCKNFETVVEKSSRAIIHKIIGDYAFGKKDYKNAWKHLNRQLELASNMMDENSKKKLIVDLQTCKELESRELCQDYTEHFIDL